MPQGPPKPHKQGAAAPLRPRPPRPASLHPKVPGRHRGKPRLGYKPPKALKAPTAPKAAGPPRSSLSPSSATSYKPSFGNRSINSDGSLPTAKVRKGLNPDGTLHIPRAPKNPYND